MTEALGGFPTVGNGLLDTAVGTQSVQKAVSQKHRFEQILSEKLENEKYNEKLLNACYDMETLFIENLYDAMRKTVPESDFFGQSLAKDIFRDMLYSEYAKIAAKSDQFGLARQIYEQLSVQKTS
jgi:flagellar protein FlgJ